MRQGVEEMVVMGLKSATRVQRIVLEAVWL